jgi:N-acetylglucosamine malate deacetylase 1
MSTDDIDAMAAQFATDVLAFGAHPDDVEIFCGGTVIRLVELGYRIGVVDLTRGEIASLGTPEQRAAEANAASRMLGLHFRENLGLPDGFIGPAPLEKMVEVIRRRRPEIMLVPWIEERHPDHAAAGVLLTKAAFFARVRKFATDPPSESFRPRQLLDYQMRYRMAPSFIMDTAAAAERKRQAIACYASQVTHDPNGVVTLLSSPRAIEAIEACDRLYGSMIGVSHGEPLRAPNALGLVDPVAHFRPNGFSEAHAFEGVR